MSCNVCVTDVIHGCDDIDTLKIILEATKDRIDLLSPVASPAEIALKKMIEIQKEHCQKTIDNCVKSASRIAIKMSNKQLIPHMKEYYKTQGYIPVEACSDLFFLDFKLPDLE